MSLTWMFRLSVFLLLAGIAAWAGATYALPLARYLTEAQDSTARDSRISDRSLAFRIPDSKPLVFAFSQPVNLAKILVHPAVGEQDRADADGFVYGLKLRWYDAKGQQLASYQKFFQAAAPDEVFTSGKNWRFFRTRPELIAEQDQVITQSPEPASRLEIELIDPDPEIIGVDLRVYERRPSLGTNTIATFERQSDRKKAGMAQANAFPADMLTREEKFFLGANSWRPVGAVGIAGRDYEGLVLYEAKIGENEEADASENPEWGSL